MGGAIHVDCRRTRSVQGFVSGIWVPFINLNSRHLDEVDYSGVLFLQSAPRQNTVGFQRSALLVSIVMVDDRTAHGPSVYTVPPQHVSQLSGFWGFLGGHLKRSVAASAYEVPVTAARVAAPGGVLPPSPLPSPPSNAEEMEKGTDFTLPAAVKSSYVYILPNAQPSGFWQQKHPL